MMIKQTTILNITLYILTISSITNAIIVKHKVNITEDGNVVTIYYTNPCNELINMVYENDRKYPTEYLTCNYVFKHRQWVQNECLNHYDRNWKTALSQLSTCVTGSRMKRGIIAAATSPIVITAATNLLKSVFSKGDQRDITKNLNNHFNFMNTYNISIMRDTFNTDVQNHLQEAKESNMVPAGVWGIFETHQNIAEKSALIRIINQECRSTRHLATKQLASITEDNEFLNIKPEQTQITEVIVTEELIKITYDQTRSIEVDEEYELQPTESNSAIIIFIIVTISLITFILLCAVIWIWLSKSKTIISDLEMN